MSQWIFLRGLTREARHWGDFPALFSSIVSGAQVHMPDLPGNGRLNKLHSPGQVDMLVEDCRRRLTGEGRQPPFFLLGLSMGGMAASRWAQRYPEEVRGCVLINMSARRLSPFHQRLQWKSYLSLLLLALRRHDATHSERLVWKLTSNRWPMDAVVLDEWVRWRRENPVSVGNALRQLLAARRFTLSGAAPAVPVLVLASGGDRLVSNTCSRRLASAWSADFRMHASAGHDLPLDDGLWTATEVEAWRKRVEGRRRETTADAKPI